MIENWRANVDLQVIVDVEGMCKIHEREGRQGYRKMQMQMEEMDSGRTKVKKTLLSLHIFAFSKHSQELVVRKILWRFPTDLVARKMLTQLTEKKFDFPVFNHLFFYFPP